MKCEYDNKKLEEIPYNCKFCNENFCSEHRLPEKHNCEGLKNYKKQKEKKYYSDKLTNKHNKNLPEYIKNPPKKSFKEKLKSLFK